MGKSLKTSIKIFAVQIVLTLIILLGLNFEYAYSNVGPITSQINTYLYSGEKIDLLEELELSRSELAKLRAIKIKAQGIENDASMQVFLNGSPLLSQKLTDSMQMIEVALTEKIRIRSLEIKSEAAFVRFARPEIVSDEPIDDDFSHKIPSAEPPTEPCNVSFKFINI